MPSGRLLIVLAALLPMSQAHAQAIGPSVFGGVAPVQLWTVDTVGGRDEAPDPDARLAVVAREKRISAPRDTAADTLRKLAALTQYKPSAARRQANIARQIARIRAQSPASAQSMEEMFREQDIFAVLDQSVAPYGMNTSNLADAFAIWWVGSWQVSQGNFDERPDPQAMADVRKQALLAVVASPRFAALTDAQKQEMADEYVFLSALMTGSMNYLKTNPAGLPAYRRSLIDAMRAGGLDLASMRLTNDGFVSAVGRR